jgi:hypothetical protein
MKSIRQLELALATGHLPPKGTPMKHKTVVSLVVLIASCGTVFVGWKYFHSSSPKTAEVTVPPDPQEGFTGACNSVISALEATGGHPNGTSFVLTSQADQSVSAWNQRLRAACRPSVSIISEAVAKTFGWNGPVLFDALPVQQWRFRQWKTNHPPPKYVDSDTGEPVVTPVPDLSDAEDLLAAESRLKELKEGRAFTPTELGELLFVELKLKKPLLLEMKQADVESMELALLIKARDAGVPIGDSDLVAWATRRRNHFQEILEGSKVPGSKAAH